MVFCVLPCKMVMVNVFPINRPHTSDNSALQTVNSTSAIAIFDKCSSLVHAVVEAEMSEMSPVVNILI